MSEGATEPVVMHWRRRGGKVSASALGIVSG